jgi:hypothetical protein
MDETQIRNAIATYLAETGWRVTRIVPYRYMEKGVPDLYAIRRGRSVWIEVKTPAKKNNVSEWQARWRDQHLAHGGEWLLATSVEDVEVLNTCTA